MTTHLEQLSLAFPRRLYADVQAALQSLPPSLTAPTAHTIGPIRLDGEELRIPARLYNPPQPGLHLVGPVDVETAIVHCLYSRHHDGFVRQQHLARLLPLTATWQAPFVFQIVGEYVVELIELLESSLDDDSRAMLLSFVEENPEFCTRTHQRVLSYWNCYYRYRWPQLESYPGKRLLARFGIHTSKRGSRATANQSQRQRGRD